MNLDEEALGEGANEICDEFLRNFGGYYAVMTSIYEFQRKSRLLSTKLALQSFE